MNFFRHTKCLGCLGVLAAFLGCSTDTAGAGGSGAAGSSKASGFGQNSANTGFMSDAASNGSGTGDKGCVAVDLLFVIDNSSSMCTYQQGLAASFGGFVDAVYAALPPGTDINVAMTTSSFCTSGPGHGELNCVPEEPPQVIEENYVEPTEGTLAGNGLQGRFFEWEGKRFVQGNTSDTASQASMKQWFSGGATAIACAGCPFDYTVGAAGYAADPINDATNAGFFRDEGSVLVLFFLTDEADHSAGGLAKYRDMILAKKSKCGGDKCIITGGLLAPWCQTANAPIEQFMGMFGETPLVGDITGGNPANPDTSKYDDVVGQTLASAINSTCAEIAPPK